MKYRKNQATDSEDEFDPSLILNHNSDPLISNSERTYADLKPVSTSMSDNDIFEDGILENTLNLIEDVEKRANDQPFLPNIENAFMNSVCQFDQPTNNQMIEQNHWTHSSSSQSSPSQDCLTRREKKTVTSQNLSFSQQSNLSPKKPGRPKKYTLDMKEIEVKAYQIRKNGKLRTRNNKEAIQIATKREANKKSVHECRMKKGEIAKRVLVLVRNLEIKMNRNQFTNGDCYPELSELMNFGQEMGYRSTSQLFEWLFPKCPGSGRKGRREQSEETSTDDDQPSTSTGRRHR